MMRIAPQVWWWVLSATAVVALCYAISPAVSPVWSFGLASLSILGIGIPHGAADHRLFAALYQSRFGRTATWRFYAAYLGAMALVGLGWFVAPRLTLLVFIALSAYHFGQANFAYLPQDRLATKVLNFSWGLWVVLSPIYFQWESAVPILESLWKAKLSTSASKVVASSWCLTTGLLLACIFWLKTRLLWVDWLKEWLALLVLGSLFYVTPLLVGFGLFFGCWHALPSAGDQIRFFQQRYASYGWRQYLIAVAPFASTAILTMVLLAYVLGRHTDFGEWWSVIFAAIAALTLPHMLILDRVYHQLEEDA